MINLGNYWTTAGWVLFIYLQSARTKTQCAQNGRKKFPIFVQHRSLRLLARSFAENVEQIYPDDFPWEDLRDFANQEDRLKAHIFPSMLIEMEHSIQTTGKK